MTLDEAIEALQKIRLELGKGNVPVVSITDVDGRFVYETTRTFEAITVPSDCDHCGEDSGIEFDAVAFIDMSPSAVETDAPPRLTLIKSPQNVT